MLYWDYGNSTRIVIFVPPKNWKTVTIKIEYYKFLEKLGSNLGLSSMADVVHYLCDKYKDDIVSEALPAMSKVSAEEVTSPN